MIKKEEDITVLFQAYSGLKGRNLVHFFASEHNVLSALLDRYDDLILKNQGIIRDFEGLSPIDIAIRDKALKSVNIMLKFMAKKQNSMNSAYILNNSLFKLMKLKLDVNQIFQTELCF